MFTVMTQSQYKGDISLQETHVGRQDKKIVLESKSLQPHSCFGSIKDLLKITRMILWLSARLLLELAALHCQNILQHDILLLNVGLKRKL